MTLIRGLALLTVLGGLVVAGCSHLVQADPAGAPCPKGGAAPPLGCANLANLKAMVADPADLARGRALTPASGAHEAGVIEQYEAPPPSAPPTGPNKERETMQ